MKHILKASVLSVVLLVGAVSSPGWAEVDSYAYKTYNPRTRRVKNEYVLQVEKLSNGLTKYNRSIKSKKYTKDEEFILDDSYQTVEWKSKRLDKDTDYTGSREGRQITLSGQLDGKELNSTIELEGDKPFYFTPKFSLTKFVLSEEKHIQFWMLRKDKLTEYLMEAKKVGIVNIKVDGQEVEAYKVKYAATGKGSRYYKRTYYFRKSDGMFIKRTALDGSITELLND